MKLKYLLERLDEPVSFEKKETNNKYKLYNKGKHYWYSK